MSLHSISAGTIAGIAIDNVILLAISGAVILWLHRRSLEKTVSSKSQRTCDAGLPPPMRQQVATAPLEVIAMPPPVYLCPYGRNQEGVRWLKCRRIGVVRVQKMREQEDDTWVRGYPRRFKISRRFGIFALGQTMQKLLTSSVLVF
jgi:hypothetical protein